MNMTRSGIEVLRQQLRSAWAKLPADMKARLEPQIMDAHNHMLLVRNFGRTGATQLVTPKTRVRPELAMVHSLLMDDPDGLLEDAINSVFTYVGSDGEIYFGGVDYDTTDPGWAYTLVAQAETLGETPPFNIHPAVIQIPDDASIAIVGDWGGNNNIAQQVATAMSAKKPDYWVHIGDVYYAGTMPPQRPYQSSNFLNVWPGAAGKSFTMNSNHDMLAHGTGYFKVALASPVFAAHKGCSYFALYNTKFRIVGLDSAYFSPDDLYDEGNLGNAHNPAQLQFLADQASQASASGQNLVLLTHHNGLSIDGSKQLALWSQVAGQLTAFKGKSILWYWGHVHAANVFNSQTTSGVTIYPRCCGHGCLPWGVATVLNSPNVSWFESNLLGPASNYFVSNGFAMLAFKGASLTETFFDQSGNSHWSASWPVTAKVVGAGG